MSNHVIQFLTDAKKYFPNCVLTRSQILFSRNIKNRPNSTISVIYCNTERKSYKKYKEERKEIEEIQERKLQEIQGYKKKGYKDTRI